jgi:transglutaminase-like putative cysteine protease
MRADENRRTMTSVILYMFGFLLLWEWMRPLEQLTDTSNILVFILFIVLGLVMYYFHVNMVVSGFIKCLYILYSLHYLYYEGAFFSPEWVLPFFMEIKENLGFVSAAEWPQLTDLFRSLLFFVLIWLMTYLLQYWLINRRQIFIFFFMTLTYITVLDTFTPYQADGAIVRTVIAGFGVMGILTFHRLMETETIRKKRTFSRKWMAPLAVMIALSVAVGLAAPKAAPIWPDPVPYIKSYGQNSGDGPGGSVARVGYGVDDSRLGGPFIGDNQVVFRTEVKSRHYWKVETKDVYTGKGWLASEEGEERIPFTEEDEVPISSFSGEGMTTNPETSSVYLFQSSPHIVYPLGVESIQPEGDVSFELDPAIEKVYAVQPLPLKEYSVSYEVPKYSVSALQESGDTQTLDGNFLERYTQLPNNLPERVKELAVEITAKESNWFNKAREIERYFRMSGFSYDQTDVAVPGARDDYVDQFLFDTKRGYCDNFSSSMVVLVRSLGIPARWVKGYTEGEYQARESATSRVFEVTNNNAHSWVEVYFPEIGWVPFEPTQGFSNNVQYSYDTQASDTTETDTAETEAQPKEEPAAPDSPEENSDTASSFTLADLGVKAKEFFAGSWKAMSLILLLLAAAAAAAYLKRSRWLPAYFIWKFRRMKKKDGRFVSAYLTLLKQLERYGLKRKQDQTLREYAAYIDHFFSTQEMSRITAQYERVLYRGSLEEGRWEETRELWENLIKKTIA